MDLFPLWNSLRIAAIAAIIVFFAGLASAYYAAKLPRLLKGLADVILTLPLVLPPTVCGYFLLVIFGNRRPVGMFLSQFGFRFAMTWYGGVLAAAVVAFPLMYRTARGAFESFDETLAYSGQTLGLSNTFVFWRIRLPVCRQGILAGAVLAFARALGEYGATSMLIGYTPGRTATISTTVYQLWRTNDEKLAYRWVLLNLVISAVVLMTVNMLERREKNRKATRKKATADGPGRSPGNFARATPESPARATPESPAKTSVESPANVRENTPANTCAESPANALAKPLPTGTGAIVEITKRAGDFKLDAKLKAGGGVSGLLGASGSGKSMTLRCIAGIATPDRGRIELDGQTLFDSEKGVDLPPQKRKIGYLFQNYALFPNMTVRRNILCGLRSEKNRAQKERRLRDVIALLRLERLEKRKPRDLSGGEQQRVALARILVGNPKMMLLDEPFSALDSHLRGQLQIQMKKLLEELGIPTLMVTHSRDEAYLLCSRIALISKGAVIAQKSTKDLFDDPGSRPAAEITGCKNIADARKTGDYEVEVPSWGVRFTTAMPVRDDLCAIGIRAHYFGPGIPQNRMPVKFTGILEEPFEYILQFRYNGQDEAAQDIWWRLAKGGKDAENPKALGVDPADILLLYNEVRDGGADGPYLE